MKPKYEITSRNYRSAKASLQRCICRNNKHGKDGKYNGKGTREKRKKQLFKFVKDLHRLGLEIPNVKSLKDKHFAAIFDMWLESDLAASTMQTTLSNLRLLCEWINKPGLVDHALDNHEHRDILSVIMKREGKNNRKIKSFSGKKLRVFEAIERVYQIDPRVAMQMGLMFIYGLRRREAAMICPMVHFNEDGTINCIKGAKGGRPRYNIEPIHDTEDVLAFLASLKEFVKERSNASLIPRHMTYEQWESYVSRVMRKAGLTKKDLGVTLHGLRHEYAQLKYLAKTGQVPRLLSENGMSISCDDFEKEQKRVISLLLGHSRVGITDHYGF